MRALYLTDRVSMLGGADQHLLQVITAMAEAGYEVRVGAGRVAEGVRLPDGVAITRIKGLAAAVATRSRLDGLDELLAWCDVVHVQNVMNPVALERATGHGPGRGKAIVTVQDHRLFCPGPGRTLPDRARCSQRMSGSLCSRCLPEAGYRQRLLELTHARQQALHDATLVVLSRYMADELASAGLPGASIIPPWVCIGPPRPDAGDGLLLAGRLVPHKDVQLAVESWRAASSSLPLLVAGTGTQEHLLQDATRLGWLSPQDLTQTLRSSRALLFAARWQEPFGIVGVEALAQGVPVIVAAEGGTIDWSQEGCLRVEPGRVTAIAEAIDRLAHDPDLAHALGERGRAWVASRFSRRRVEPELRQLYENVSGHE